MCIRDRPTPLIIVCFNPLWVRTGQNFSLTLFQNLLGSDSKRNKKITKTQNPQSLSSVSYTHLDVYKRQHTHTRLIKFSNSVHFIDVYFKIHNEIKIYHSYQKSSRCIHKLSCNGTVWVYQV